MRNRIVTARLAGVLAAVDRRSPKHVGVKGVRHAFTAAIDFLRAGYPHEAPHTGYSPLLALNGPPALTLAQQDCILKDLEHQPICTTNIDVAITKATNRLPTPTQTRAVLRALHRRTSQQ